MDENWGRKQLTFLLPHLTRPGIEMSNPLRLHIHLGMSVSKPMKNSKRVYFPDHDVKPP